MRRAALPLALCILLVPAASSASSIGDLDRAFGSDGVVLVDGPGGGSGGRERDEFVLDAAALDDGRVLMVGTEWVHSSTFVVGPQPAMVGAMLRPDGSLDPTYSGDGILYDTGSSFASGVAVQPDGKAVLAGGASEVYAYEGIPSWLSITRFGKEGLLDTTFGSGGRVEDASVGPAVDVAVDHEGRIVVLHGGLLVSRYLPDGSIDATFGDEGRNASIVRSDETVWSASPADPALTGCGGQAWWCTQGALSVLPGGEILVADVIYPDDSDAEPYAVVAKLSPEGTMDPGFGSGGRVVLPSSAQPYDLDVDGARFVLTSYPTAQGEALVIASLTASGEMDESFGDRGIVTVPTPGFYGPANAFIDEQGRVVAVVGDHEGAPLLVRVTRDGVLDSSFSDDGMRTIDLWSPLRIEALAPVSERLYVFGTDHGRDWDLDMMATRLLWEREPEPPACTILGTDGNDVLRGTSADETICGGAGDDKLMGFGGDDVLLGGEGNDHLHARDKRAGDSLDGGPGSDACLFDEGDVTHSCRPDDV